jgi:hypothetical protein
LISSALSIISEEATRAIKNKVKKYLILYKIIF